MSTSDPKVVWIQLGILLRRLREERDLTASDAADHLDCSTAKVSKIENGKQSIRSHEVSALLEFYGADDAATAEALRLAAVPQPRRRGIYRDSVPDWFRRFLVLESEATELRIYENEIITGLLQTEGYARTLLRAGAPLGSERDLDQQVVKRMNRAEILTKEDAPQVHVILHEACLHRVVGDDRVMHAQLEHLEERARLPNLHLHILPFRPEPTPNHDESVTARSTFALLKLETSGVMVYYEDVAGGNYPDDASIINAFASVYQRLSNVALSEHSSAELIANMKTEYR